MRADVYRAWQWLALPAATWFALETVLHIATGDPRAAAATAGIFTLALGSIFAARTRRASLVPAR